MSIFESYAATAGAAEDILDIIQQIEPEETPLLSRIGTSRADNKVHIWLQDSIGSATATGGASEEGASATTKTITDRSRVTNYTQITTYTFGISGSQEAITHIGLDSEYAYQLEKAMKAVKIWMEQILINSTSATGASGTARTMTGLIDAIQTSVLTGSAGVCALTETMFNDLLEDIFDQGGKPDLCIVNGYNKRRISAFSTDNTRYLEVNAQGRLLNYVSVYESDFGRIEILLDRYCPKGDVPVIQQDKWKVAYLRKPFVNPLAIDGDRKRAQVITEYTLEFLNEKSSGRYSAVKSA